MDAGHDRIYEEGELRAAWREVRETDRAGERSRGDGERESTGGRRKSARLRLIRALAASMLPAGSEATGFLVRLDQFLQEANVSPGVLDVLIRHLNRDHPTLKRRRA
jgi:hypothetical protein